uniref:non-specific serine/threonine protein kinase n=1 Tax=Caenorhabditis tropicalis TaxID=1561998 RepID=A0A1I7T7W8_9PELO
MAGAPILIQLASGDRVSRFTVFKKLGEGTFGAVYAVRDDSGAEHALKAELSTEKIPLLKLELYVMQKLTQKGGKHFPTLIDKGHHQNFNFIVMKFLGNSLQDAKKTGPNSHLNLGSAIGASIQCLEALEELHWCGFLHRDVKPGNFCLGRAECGELRKIFVLDFGLCRRFVNDQNVMLQPRRKAPYRGTPRYAPIASHNGMEHGRKDDVESWFYMLVDFTNAALPWKVVTQIKEVGEMKKNSRFDPLMSQMLAGCPMDEYRQIMSHIDGLSFFMEPNYGFIYSTLRKLMQTRNVQEFPYDWEAEYAAK